MRDIKGLIEIYDWLKNAQIEDPLFEEISLPEMMQDVWWFETAIQADILHVMQSSKRIKGVFIGWPTKGRVDDRGTAIPDLEGERFFIRFSYVSPKYRSDKNMGEICTQIYKCWPQIKGLFKQKKPKKAENKPEESE